ncbi:MAG: 5'-nucleotidase C-terminal domain-containing protein [Spirochaetes bacterium]|nr:5'-nucleotidase C-terminal domain-containing protein [Spirochaetota bacterium]
MIIKKTKILFILSILLLIFNLFSCSTGVYTQKNPEKIYTLALLHTNDTHGRILPFNYNRIDDQAGMPARATFINQIRKDYENVLILDAGDFNTGTLESNYFKAEPDVLGMNYMGYDAVCLGNHEFDNDLSILKKQMELAKFPFLSANVFTKEGKYLGKPYIIKDFKGFKVAIFGLTTNETLKIGNPSIIKDLIIKNEVEVAKSLVPELKKQADIVIALVHMGIYNDDIEGYGSKWLARNIPGIDVIVDGHTHTYLREPIKINNTFIVQAADWGRYVGRAVIKIQNMKVIGFEWIPVPINIKGSFKNQDGSTFISYINHKGEADQNAFFKQDEGLLKILMPYKDKVKEILAEKIGVSEGEFPNDNVRKMETELGDLVADSMLWFTKKFGVDFALQNGGGIRKALPAGEISKGLIYEILPFDNTIVIVELKGSDVIELFNYIATIPNGAGAFPQVSDGVTFTINYQTGKCENILINGKPIDPNKIYKIATNSYLATGGDGYTIFKKAISFYDTSMFQRDVFIEYIKYLGGKIKPILYGRIKIIQKTAYFIKFILFKFAS